MGFFVFFSGTRPWELCCHVWCWLASFPAESNRTDGRLAMKCGAKLNMWLNSQKGQSPYCMKGSLWLPQNWLEGLFFYAIIYCFLLLDIKQLQRKGETFWWLCMGGNEVWEKEKWEQSVHVIVPWFKMRFRVSCNESMFCYKLKIKRGILFAFSIISCCSIHLITKQKNSAV